MFPPPPWIPDKPDVPPGSEADAEEEQERKPVGLDMV